jgi:hypothetical protein
VDEVSKRVDHAPDDYDSKWRRIDARDSERRHMLRYQRRNGGTRLFVLGAVVATAAASAASSLTASAAVTSCSGLGTISGTTDINYGACNTDQNGGVGSVAFSSDGKSVTMKAKSKLGDEQVAGFWQSNGPISVVATRICVAVVITDLKVKSGVVDEQLILSYDGVQHDPLTWSVTTNGIQPAYCGSVPVGATNVWWQLVTLASGAKVRVSQTLVTVGYSYT